MLTDTQILEGLRVRNPNASLLDVAATRRFMKCFDCEDSEFFEEANDKILASMDICLERVNNARDDFEAREIIQETYKKL